MGIDEKLSISLSFSHVQFKTERELFKMMSLALVMIAVAVLPAALATTTTCKGALMAVAGGADKGFWYENLSEPMGIQFLSDLCHPEGRLFRPRSRDEFISVQDGIVPKTVLQNESTGRSPVDFRKYEQYNETVWGTYTFPFELMAPGMWLPAEPNNFGGNE